LSPAAELRLLEHLMLVPEEERGEFAGRWLAVLGRLERDVDPKFDPADLPLLNVAVPRDAAGVAVEAVEDPELRQRYAQAVSENQAHAERYRQQVQARRLLSRYRPSAQRFLVACYAHNPAGADGLDELLAEHGVTGGWADAVGTAVRRERPG
jgi:hypothetical protein